MLSLQDPSIPAADDFPDDGMEINRYTLTGDYDLAFCSLLRQRCAKDSLLAPDDLAVQFRAHMNRGVFLLASRVSDLDSIADIVAACTAPSEQG
jgi:DNA sulfur modification protein DndE